MIAQLATVWQFWLVTEPAKTVQAAFGDDSVRRRETYTFREWCFTCLFLLCIIHFAILVKQLITQFHWYREFFLHFSQLFW